MKFNPLNKLLLITSVVVCFLFGSVETWSQTVLLSGASNPYVKYNLLVKDTLYVESRSEIAQYYVAHNLYYGFSGINRMRVQSTGALSVSDNTVFDQQLILNASHDGGSQDGGFNSTTYSSAGFGNTITGRLAGGTGLVPLVTPLNGKLIELTGKGYEGAAFSASNRFSIGGYTAETYSIGGQGTRGIIKTTPVGSTQLTTSMVWDENGSAGITPNDTLSEIYPVGFDPVNARWFEILSAGTGADGGLFMFNRSHTNGIALWYDKSANISYLDDMLDNAGSLFQFRAKGLNVTPVNAFSYNGAGNFQFNKKVSLYNNAAPTDGNLLIGNTGNATYDIGGITSTNGNVTVAYSNPNINLSVDSVVYQKAFVNLTSQSAAIAATTVYAVPASGAGMYRVSWVASVTTAASVSSIVGPFNIRYTSGGVVKTNSATAINNFNQSAGNSTATSVISGCFIAFCDASTNLKYIMGYTSTGTAMVYSLRIEVERIDL